MSDFKKAIQRIALRQPYSLGHQAQDMGRLAAVGKIAYDHMQEMNRVGDALVGEFGRGGGKNIDNYYHALLQCRLAAMGEQEKGLALGDMKETFMDKPNKLLRTKTPWNEIKKDSTKDLQNNEYGATIKLDNMNIPCEVLLDDKRTENMRKKGIR
jgi:hypothetical protein